jgi:Fe-S-cluster-containing dehydrogenase component
MSKRPGPSEDLSQRAPLEPIDDVFVVDLRRCIGCHACSVACKTAHEVPLGEFPLRVRWLPRPEGQTWAFLPVFSERLCGGDPASLAAGMDPACVRACPTDALVYGERDSADLLSLLERHEADSLTGPEAVDLKRNVTYLGLAGFEGRELYRGAALDPRDPDPIYEQR